MAKGRRAKTPKTLAEKIEAQYPGFAQEVLGLAVPALEKRIATYQKELEDSENHKTENDMLKQAKEQVEQLAGPYRDVKKAVSMKTKFLVSLIREKGGQ